MYDLENVELLIIIVFTIILSLQGKKKKTFNGVMEK